MIKVVGSKVKDTFHYLDDIREPFYTEDDPNNYYYNEICGHLANDKQDDIMGLEHYRRTFFKDGHPMTRKDMEEILSEYDVICKEEHGPYGNHTNLTVLSGCSRHGINYLSDAIFALDMFPELKEQANYNKHYGCNMFIAKGDKYMEMRKELERIVKGMLPVFHKQSMISYFCETIVTPYLIKKYNKKIYVAEVKVW